MTGEIIVFDSGIGGLSILQAIQSRQLSYPLTYLADQANFPYGPRSPAWITKRLARIATWVAARRPAAFVVACNTATVSGINKTRQLVSCPVIGVEPVVKPLANFTHPVLLATATTLASPRTKQLIRKYQPATATYHPLGLVEAIESADPDLLQTQVARLVDYLNVSAADGTGLSCTHYPLIKKSLQQALPQLTIVDPSKAVVSRLATLLPAQPPTTTNLQFFTTGNSQALAKQVQYYLGLSVSPIQLII